ncbi:MAG: hypothetical protein FWE73_10885 [Candidatus Bathyarchaeota archaeon]|jgi:hypothetical protein|nr:hypothetical protein [Candidatus Termitimicrobium sp.]
MQCGAFNAEGSLNCSNCGAPLVAQKAETRPYNRYVQYRSYGDATPKRDHSGLGLFIMGLLIVLIGGVALRGSVEFWTYFWPIILILLGVWVLILGVQRSRKTGEH